MADRPAGAATETQRAYVVEPALTSQRELGALVADYIAEAQRLRAVPMSVSPFECYLRKLS